MILKNSWGKYDNIWVIGDIRLERNPNFHMETASAKTGFILYKGIEGADKYMQSVFVTDFQKDVYLILDEHIKNGTEILTHLELAVQYCMRLGMFDDGYRKIQINDFIEEIKAMTEEKDGFRYNEVLQIIGGNTDNISTEGIEFIERKTYEKLVIEHVVPKYILLGDKNYIVQEFYSNLRFAVTNLITNGVFQEIIT